MRTMIKVEIPVESGNEAIQEGTMEEVLKDFMSTWEPEAAYFIAMNGVRTAILVVDIKDPSQIPLITEPLFMELDASVEMFPCMNADDLMKGLAQLPTEEE